MTGTERGQGAHLWAGVGQSPWSTESAPLWRWLASAHLWGQGVHAEVCIKISKQGGRTDQQGGQAGRSKGLGPESMPLF